MISFGSGLPAVAADANSARRSGPGASVGEADFTSCLAEADPDRCGEQSVSDKDEARAGEGPNASVFPAFGLPLSPAAQGAATGNGRALQGSLSGRQTAGQPVQAAVVAIPAMMFRRATDAGDAGDVPALRMNPPLTVGETIQPARMYTDGPDVGEKTQKTKGAVDTGIVADAPNASAVHDIDPDTMAVASSRPPAPAAQAPRGFSALSEAGLSFAEKALAIRRIDGPGGPRISIHLRPHPSGSAAAQTLQIHLHPASLGKVTARLTAEDGRVSIELVAEDELAFRQLSGDTAALQALFVATGTPVAELSVRWQGEASDAGRNRDSAAPQDNGSRAWRGHREGKGRHEDDAYPGVGSDRGGRRPGLYV